MEDEYNDDGNDSDHEVLEREHSKLLSAVRELDGKQRVKPPSRKETSRQISEFNLGKHQIKDDTVRIPELTKALEKRASHVEISEKLKTLKQKAKPLERPLEKFEAEKIKRAVGFSNTKKQLDRWNAFVDRNRVAENLTFPLIPKGSITLDTTQEFVKRFESQSELEAQISEILSRCNVAKEQREAKEREEKEEEFPLKLEEIIERRKEMAKLRAQQSYREAKAHRQKKIKSKSFHRTLRRQRIKQQLKDFEKLQKTDPEAALKQLEQIERARAEERMTLRHRNTGKWARSRAIRAKYNDQTRQELAEQLAISRDLTRKVAVEESSSDEAFEEEPNMNAASNSDNPWVNGKTESEVENFVRGYQRFWEQKNASQSLGVTDSNPLQESERRASGEKLKSNDNVSSKCKQENTDDTAETSGDSGLCSNEVSEMGKIQFTPVRKDGTKSSRTSPLGQDSKECIDEKFQTRFTPTHETNKRKKLLVAEVKKRRKVENSEVKKSSKAPSLVTGMSGCWEVTVDNSAAGSPVENVMQAKAAGKGKKNKKVAATVDSKVEDIDELFLKMEEKMKDSVNKKIAKYRQELLPNGGISSTGDREDVKESFSSEMRKQMKHPELDEALTEKAARHNRQVPAIEIDKLQKMSSVSIDDQKIVPQKSDIDPKKFIAVKAKLLDTELPDVADMEEALDDDVDESARQLTITEAFADDDVVDQFRKEKEETIKKSEPEDIDLSLPGWGTWGGKGILVGVPKKKKKRFIIKFPKPPPRKDANKGDVIINEEKDVKIKEHQVSDLPFPFTTVRDFEASIRAPIGTTWITHSAHRKLTLPKYKTMIGKVIKPVDEEVMLKRKPVRNSDTKNKL